MIGSVSVLPDYIRRIYSAYTKEPEKPNVLVVGYGWAGASFVKNLDTSKYNLRVVSSQTKRLNQPEMIHDLKATYKLPPKDITVIEDNCVSVEEDKKLVVGSKAGYKYDYLVVASGGDPNDFHIPGVKENCIMFKSEPQLTEVKNLLKDGKRITIVGAGPTGVELAFKLKQQTGAPIEVLEATTTILPGFHKNLQTKVLEIMREKGIELHTNQKIQMIEDVKDSTVKILKTQTKQYATANKPIWTCGIRPSNFILTLTPTAKPDEYLEVKPNIYAIGDSIRGHGPPTAQNAEQQGKYLADQFNTNFKRKQSYEFKEFARVLDLSEDGLLLEKNGYIISVPSVFRKIFYALID